MTGTASRSPIAGSRSGDAVDELVAGFAMPADHADRLAAAHPVDDRGLEPLPGQRHLEVVAHPAVHRDVGEDAALDRRDPVHRACAVADHAAARLDDDAAAVGQQRPGLRHHRVGVVVEARRMLVVGVAHAEAATEVVDVEGAELRDGFDRLRQLFDVEQLRSDMGVHAVEPHLGAALDPRDRVARVVGQQAEFRAGVAGRLRCVGGGLDAGDDPHQARLPMTRGTMRSSRSMSSKLSTTTRPTPCLTASASSSSVLALPCSTSWSGSAPALSAVRISPPPATSRCRPSSTITR